MKWFHLMIIFILLLVGIIGIDNALAQELSKPKLKLIVDFDNPLKPGELGNVRVTIKNIGDADAKNVKVRVTVSSLLWLPIEKFYDKISPKGVKHINFRVYIPYNYITIYNKYKIKVIAEYSDNNGNKYIKTAEDYIEVPYIKTKIKVFNITKSSPILGKVIIKGRLIREATEDGIPHAKVKVYVCGVYYIGQFELLNVTTDDGGYFNISFYYLPLSGKNLEIFLRYDGNSTFSPAETRIYTITTNENKSLNFPIVNPIQVDYRYINGSSNWISTYTKAIYSKGLITDILKFVSSFSVVKAIGPLDYMTLGSAAVAGKSSSSGLIVRSFIFRPCENGYYNVNITYRYRLAYVGSIVHAFDIANLILTTVTLPYDIYYNLIKVAIKNTLKEGIKKGFVIIKNGKYIITNKEKYHIYLSKNLAKELAKFTLKKTLEDSLTHELEDLSEKINHDMGYQFLNVRIFEVDPSTNTTIEICNKTVDLLPEQHEKGQLVKFTFKQKESSVSVNMPIYLNKDKIYIVTVENKGVTVANGNIADVYMAVIASIGEPILKIQPIKVSPIPTPIPTPTPTPTPIPLKPPKILMIKPNVNDVYLTKGQSMLFEAKVYDPDTEILKVTWMIDNSIVYTGSVDSGKVSSITVDSRNLGYGKHVVTLIVSDGKHEVSHKWNLYIVKPSQPPKRTNRYECRFVVISYDKSSKRWIPTQIELNGHYYKFVVKALGKDSVNGHVVPIVLMEVYRDGKKIYDDTLRCTAKFRRLGDNLYAWDISVGISNDFVCLNIAVPSDTVKATTPEICYTGDKVKAHIVVPYSPSSTNVEVHEVVNREISYKSPKYSVKVTGRDVYITLTAPNKLGVYKYAIYDVNSKEGFLVFWTLTVKPRVETWSLTVNVTGLGSKATHVKIIQDGRVVREGIVKDGNLFVTRLKQGTYWIEVGRFVPISEYARYHCEKYKEYVVLNSNKKVAFKYEKEYRLILEVNPANGGKVVVSPNKGWYHENENVKLRAIPNKGYEFKKWLVSLPGLRCAKCMLERTENPIYIKMDRPKIITAIFKKKGEDVIDRYDINKDGRISKDELILAFDDWMSGVITKAEFIKVFDKWIESG